jgi:hypothetical protein
MAANYFMLTKGGRSGLDCPALPPLTVAGSTWSLADVEFADTFASGLGVWETDSYNWDTDAQDFNPAVVSGRVRMATSASVTGETWVGREFTQSWRDLTFTAEIAPTAISSTQFVSMQLNWNAVLGSSFLSMYVEGGHLKTHVSGGGTEDLGTYNPTNHRWWRVIEKTGVFTFSTSPDGTTWIERSILPHTFLAAVGLGSVTFNSTNDASAALEVFVDNVTVKLGEGVVGNAADPANYALDLISRRDSLVAAEAPMRYVPITGFHGSGFKAVRTPGVADDSANSIAQQVYDHGWKLGYDFTRATPISWPPSSELAIVPVTGTPVMDDGQGVYAFTTITRAAGTGTIRQILSGAGGSTRQIANILDLLAASPSLLSTAAGTTVPWSPQATSSFGAAFWHRAAIAGRAAVSLLFPHGLATTVPVLHSALGWGMTALTAKEHGLVGSGTLFTTAEYNAATAPLRAIITLPPGY